MEHLETTESQNLESVRQAVKALIAIEWIEPGDTVFDVGAHLGTHTKFYLNQVGNTGKVISFEAHPGVYKVLREKFANCKNVTTILGAVSDTTGDRVQMKISDENTLEPYSTIEPAVMSDRSRIPGGGKLIEVTTLSLDDYFRNNCIENCSILKIDVEGHESSVIRGAEEFIRKFSPIVILEYWYDTSQNAPETISQLENLGYILLDCKNLNQIGPQYLSITTTDLVAIPFPLLHVFLNRFNDIPEFTKVIIRSHTKQIMDNVETWIRLLIYLKKERKLLLWGTGKFSQILTQHLLSHGITADSYLDSNQEKVGSRFMSRSVNTLRQFDNLDNYFIVIGSSFDEEIALKCSAFGLKEFDGFMRPLAFNNFYPTKS